MDEIFDLKKGNWLLELKKTKLLKHIHEMAS